MVGRIDIEQDNLVFRLVGIDKILALKSEIKVPLEHVKSISTEKVDWNYFKMVKLVGTRIPEVLVDGTFLSKDGILFYEMHHPDRCVTVELEGGKYRKIIFEVEDKEGTADKIRQLIKP